MLLEEYWPLVAKGTISEPEDVLACTREYQSNNDYVSAFLDECVEKAADAYMIFTEAFSEFKTWVRDDSVPIRVPKKSEFKKALEKRMGRSVTISGCIGFKGVRLRNRFGGGPQQGDDIDN
jgi:phage/plasmid-associated DNA primase